MPTMPGTRNGKFDSAGSLVFICHGSCEQSNVEDYFRMLYYFQHSAHATVTDVLLYASMIMSLQSVQAQQLHGECARNSA